MKSILPLLLVFLVPGCLCCWSETQGDIPYAGDLSDNPKSDNDAGILNQAESKSSASTLTEPSAKAQGGLFGLREFVDTGEPYYCTFVDKKTLSETWRYQLWAKEWKYYTIVDMGKNKKYNLIYDQTFQYVWPEGRTTGTKYPIRSITGMTGHVDEEAYSVGSEVLYLLNYINPDTITQVSCDKAEVSDSRFSPPPQIRFDTGKSVMDAKRDE